MARLRSLLPPRRSHRCAAASLTLALALGAALPARATPQGAPGGDPAQARELYKKGKKAYDDGNMREAYEAYIAAWNLQKTFDIAGNLAAVELQTARYRDAAEHLKFALANLPVSGDADKRRAAIDGMLRDAKKQIGTLTIKVTPDFAEVKIDGRAYSKAELGDEVFVDAGDHMVSATAQDHVAVEQKVQVAKGALVPVSLVLPKGAGAPAGPTDSPGPSPVTVAGFIASGLGLAAGAALAIVSKTKADAADSQFESIRAKSGAHACVGASPSDVCKALHDARASRDTFANAAFWTFIGAGAVAGGTLIYTFVAPRSGGKPAGASALPIVSPQGAGIVVTGFF